MKQLLSERIQHLNSSEIAELEDFAEYLIFKRSNNQESLKDDIPTSLITKIISDSESFDWLDSIDEDVYSPTDGVPAKW
jgi:hypothetical protein